MLDILNEIITFIGNSYNDNKIIYNTIGSIFAVMLFYKKIYVILGFFATRKFKPAKINTNMQFLLLQEMKKKL